MEVCKVCAAITNNYKIAKLALEVERGKVLKKEFANALGVDTTTIGYHFKNCKLDPKDFSTPPKRTGDQFADDLLELEALLPVLIKRVKNWLATPIDYERINIEKAISSLIREGRGLAKDLALIKGQIQAPALVQVKQLNIQYNQLQNVILGELCPVCQQKILELLEAEIVG